MKCVASVLISETTTLEPVVGGREPITPGTQDQSDIRISTVYLPKVSSGTRLSTKPEREDENLGELHADCPVRDSNPGPRSSSQALCPLDHGAELAEVGGIRWSSAWPRCSSPSALEPVAGSPLPGNTGPECQPGYHSLPSATARSVLLA